MTQLTNEAGVGGTATDSSVDFVNFYQVLEVEPDATTTHLRRKINELYSEAQSNRDHRNVGKRRRYEALCELLPYCRIVLLDPDKRVRYDRFLEQAQAGTEPLPEFETIMEEIAGSVGDGKGEGLHTKSGLLGVQGDDDYLPVADSARASDASDKSVATKPVVPKPKAAPRPPRQPHDDHIDPLTGSAISVGMFCLAFIAMYIIHGEVWSAELELLPAAICGVVTWILSHPKRPSDS